MIRTSKTKNCCIYLKLPVYVTIVISFLDWPKTLSKSHIPRILRENLKFCLLSSKIPKNQFFYNSNVVNKSL